MQGVDYSLIDKVLEDERALRDLSDEEFKVLAGGLVAEQQEDRKTQQIVYYQPVSERSKRIHLTKAKVVGVGGGNGSSKTETCLVELVACATGVFPACLHDEFKRKFRGPINTRVVLESLSNVMHQIILPKLQWWKWTGVGEQGGDQGHWGWIPKQCLTNGSWDRSWSEKQRTLTVKCFHPDTGEYLGDSKIQFMSHDQDPSDFASGDYHIVLHDEPPMEAIWVENEARTMRVNGRMMLAMTWPDDPSIPVDWIFDRVHDKASEDLDADVVWFELHTTDNKNLDQKAIQSQMSRWSETMRQVRIFGKPIRFSNLIHPDFSDRDGWWCFACGKQTMVSGEGEAFHEACMECGSLRVTKYCHVMSFDHNPSLPVMWVLDPHPRKAHMFMWIAIDPHDDLWVVRDGECDGEPDDVRQMVFDIETEMGMHVTSRLMDPNMGASSPGVRRQVTWQDIFEEAGLTCDLADDSEVGRSRVNEYLKPDPDIEQPRLHVHRRCAQTIFQIKRYVWGEYSRITAGDRDIKQVPRAKYDDYPTMLKYALNSSPSFRQLKAGAPIVGPRSISRTLKAGKAYRRK